MPQPVPGKLVVGMGCWTLIWDGWAMTGPGCSCVTWQGEATAGYGVGMAALDAGSCVVAYCAGTNCGVLGKTPALGEMGRA